ncbi:MAG: mevalonate kinase, partial [Pseudomonadales bacterium]
NHRLLGSPNAPELAGIMATVGLAQNFAALRALSTDGIQQNHMTLHARSVASTANVPDHLFDTVVEALIESGEIKVWKAEEIVAKLTQVSGERTPAPAERSSASGKVILLGEHAVVYGRPAIALPIPLAVEAIVRPGGNGASLVIPRWGVEQKVRGPGTHGLTGMLGSLLRTLGLAETGMTIEVIPHVPRAMGLGGSAALAVAIIRALDRAFRLGLSDEAINGHAYECERFAHGTPSGIDNTLATWGRPILFQRGLGRGSDDAPELNANRVEPLVIGGSLPLVIGITGKESLTANTVARVRAIHAARPARYDAIFDQIASLVRSALVTLREGNLTELGELMNLCQGFLNALQVSSPELEELIHIARAHGAIGAKLTGGGGGGSIIALCPGEQEAVAAAIQRAGYQALTVTVA